MMSITMMADRRVTVYRLSDYVLDPVAATAATYAPSRQPARPCSIEVTTTGGAGGTVQISGIVAGVADSETLTFAGPDVLATRKLFQSLNASVAFTITGLAGATISVKAVGADGSAIQTVTGAVATDWPMRMDRGLTKWPGKYAQGVAQTEETRFYMDYTSWSPRENDIFVDGLTSEQFMVIGVPTYHGGGMYIPHHTEVRVVRREGSLVGAGGGSGGGGGGGGGGGDGIPTTTTYTTIDAVSAGDVLAFTADGKVRLANNDFSLTPPRFFARLVAYEAAAANAPVKCYVVSGQQVPVRFASAPPSSANGYVVYLSSTSGRATHLAPTTGGSVVCQIGTVLDADGSKTTCQVVLLFSDMPIKIPV